MRRLRTLLFWAVLLPAAAWGDGTAQESAVARFVLEPVVGGLKQPSGMVFLPDGRALVCDRTAPALYLLDVSARRLTPVEGLPAIVTQEDAGLLDVVLHPGYANNGWIYLNYSEGEPRDCTTVVERARGSKTIASWGASAS